MLKFDKEITKAKMLGDHELFMWIFDYTITSFFRQIVRPD